MGKDIHLKFFGQGFLGKNLADSFEDRGFKDTVRYSLESRHVGNRSLMSKRPGVSFVCVPTPNRKGVFDPSAVRSSLSLCHPKDIAVIRSTVTPDFFRSAEEHERPETVVYMPEFLDADTARRDIDNPGRNIIGVEDPNSEKDLEAVDLLLSIMPKAPYEKVCGLEEAALVKLVGNAFFFLKNVTFNVVFDVSEKVGCDYEVIREAVSADPRIGPVHTFIDDKGGRGAGGMCLPKDMRTFRELVDAALGPFDEANQILYAAERRNRKLLSNSGKDRKITKEVYG